MGWQNPTAKEMLKGVNTFRIGAEWKVIPQFAFRLGYNYMSAAFKKTAFKRKKTPFEEPAICRMVLFERGFTVVISYLFPNIFSYSGVPSSVAK